MLISFTQFIFFSEFEDRRCCLVSKIYLKIHCNRKIEKFRQTSDEEWPTKLPFAVLASNTKIKRATKYSAFDIMFERKCDVIPLLNLSENLTTIGRYESSS